MGILLDVLEYKVVPNIQLYSHPFTMKCVLWLHRLIEPPLSSPLLTQQQEHHNNNNTTTTTTTTAQYNTINVDGYNIIQQQVIIIGG
jgi:hypothetical protein